jgi:hypothetical protein
MPPTVYALLMARKAIKQGNLIYATAYMTAYEQLRIEGFPEPDGVYQGREINGDRTFRELEVFFQFTFGQELAPMP